MSHAPTAVAKSAGTNYGTKGRTLLDDHSVTGHLMAAVGTDTMEVIQQTVFYFTSKATSLLSDSSNAANIASASLFRSMGSWGHTR